MITSLHFENFKSLADLTVDLERFTVIVGGNGCGKSSVLKGASLLSEVLTANWGATPMPPLSRLQGVFSGPYQPQRLKTQNGGSKLQFTATADRAHVFSVGVSPSPIPFHPFPDYEISLQNVATGTGQSATLRLPAEQPSPSAWIILGAPEVETLRSTVLLHLDASAMVNWSVAEGGTPQLKANGEGLASMLAYLKGAKEEVVDQIAAALAKVVPGVRRIRTYPETIEDWTSEPLNVEGQQVYRAVHRKRVGHRFEIEFDQIGNIPADLLSEGTVLALGLITKLHEPNSPKLILLDDIDRALHPKAQFELVRTLRALLEERSDLQIVCTTHSADLLSQFRPEEVRVMALDAERHSRIKPLTAHPDFDKVKDGFKSGEIWSFLGEDWVLDDKANG